MKVTDLTELVAASLNDVIPIVDVSEDITKKVQTVNLPISTATQTALDTKQDTLVSGTTIKTVNSTSLLGSGDVAVQETLVSGTNIKTINSTSLLGSGDISISANPSGGAGLIQFSDGSAFASDSNLFWDNTNKRLGIGESTPTARVHIKGSGSTSATTSLLVQNSAGTELFKVIDDAINQPVRMPTARIADFIFVSGTVIQNTQTRLVATTGGVSVNSSYAFANSSSILDVASTTKGFLPPRMTTTQKNAISSPAAGLQVYDTTLNQMSYYNGTSWINF